MSGANKRNKELFLKEKRKIFPWSLRIGSVSGHCPNTQAVDDSAWASLLTCRAWKAARDESLVFSNLFWVCVSLMAWRGFLDSLAYMEALKSKSRPRHLSFPIFSFPGFLVYYLSKCPLPNMTEASSHAYKCLQQKPPWKLPSLGNFGNEQ